MFDKGQDRKRKFSEKSGDHSNVRDPRFKKVRKDKSGNDGIGGGRPKFKVALNQKSNFGQGQNRKSNFGGSGQNRKPNFKSGPKSGPSSGKFRKGKQADFGDKRKDGKKKRKVQVFNSHGVGPNYKRK